METGNNSSFVIATLSKGFKGDRDTCGNEKKSNPRESYCSNAIECLGAQSLKDACSLFRKLKL